MTVLAIGPLEPRDLTAAVRLSTQAGWNQLEADWARLIALWPDNCFAGRLDGQLVATATLAVYPPDLAWVGMMLVDASCRGRGFGGQMLDAVLAAADRAGVRWIGLDATDLGRPVYVKRGFVDAVGIDRRVLAAMNRPYENDEHTAEPLHESNWGPLLRLDREVFGADRSRLLQRLRDEPDSEIRIVRDGRDVVGHGFRRPGRRAEQIGPVVTRSPDIAVRVIRSLAATNEHACAVQLDAFRGGGLDGWLEQVEFALTRRLVRMYRDPATASLARLPGHAFTAAGLELG